MKSTAKGFFRSGETEKIWMDEKILVGEIKENSEEIIDYPKLTKSTKKSYIKHGLSFDGFLLIFNIYLQLIRENAE